MSGPVGGGVQGQGEQIVGSVQLDLVAKPNGAHRAEVAAYTPAAEIDQVFRVHELIVGESALFCATGISDSPLLPGCRLVGHRVETHSILMRSRSGTVRRIHATHDLDRKVVPLRA